MTLRVGSLFTGYGGLDMGVRAVLGGDVAWHSEIDSVACRVLTHHWPDVPNLGDVTAVDWAAARPVDVLTAGFPCQDISVAGQRAGLRPGTRSGLWAHTAHAVAQLRPRLVVIENVRGILSADAHCDLEPCPWCLGDDEGRPLRALGGVLGDLAQLGYDARWCGLRAADVGAPHARYRIFIVAWPAADSDRVGQQRPGGARDRWCGSPHHRQPPTHPHGHPVWEQPVPVAGCCGAALLRQHGGERGACAAAHPVGPGLKPRCWLGRPAGSAAVRDDPPAAAHPHGDGPSCARTGAEPDARNDADGCRAPVQWGDYGPAIRRWERVLGRSAPEPTRAGRRGGQQLSPLFVEWLMGLPEGWVTRGITRNEALKLLGNGVVPQQCAAGLRHLLAHTAGRAAA